MGLRLFAVSCVSCQGVRVFSGGEGLNSFLEVVQFLGGRIHNKISIFSMQSFTIHTPKRTKLQFTIKFEEAPIPI